MIYRPSSDIYRVHWAPVPSGACWDKLADASDATYIEFAGQPTDFLDENRYEGGLALDPTFRDEKRFVCKCANVTLRVSTVDVALARCPAEMRVNLLSGTTLLGSATKPLSNGGPHELVFKINDIPEEPSDFRLSFIAKVNVQTPFVVKVHYARVDAP